MDMRWWRETLKRDTRSIIRTVLQNSKHHFLPGAEDRIIAQLSDDPYDLTWVDNAQRLINEEILAFDRPRSQAELQVLIGWQAWMIYREFMI